MIRALGYPIADGIISGRDEVNHICDECGRRFVGMSAYGTHMVRHHGGL